MHPTVMTILAEERRTRPALLGPAKRRGRLARARGVRRVFSLNRPRRFTRAAV